MTLNVGLIRVVTLKDKILLNKHGDILMRNFSGLQIESRCIEDQDYGIYSPETDAIAVPKIVALAKAYEREGKDVIFISCAADPAIKEARAAVNIPVLAAGSCCAGLARAYGDSIGAMGIEESIPYAMKAILNESLVDYIRPKNVKTTMDLLKPENKESILKSALLLKEKGSNAIALACTGMATIEIAEDIRKITGLPVIDPIIASGIMLENIRRM